MVPVQEIVCFLALFRRKGKFINKGNWGGEEVISRNFGEKRQEKRHALVLPGFSHGLEKVFSRPPHFESPPKMRLSGGVRISIQQSPVARYIRSFGKKNVFKKRIKVGAPHPISFPPSMKMARFRRTKKMPPSVNKMSKKVFWGVFFVGCCLFLLFCFFGKNCKFRPH